MIVGAIKVYFDQDSAITLNRKHMGDNLEQKGAFSKFFHNFESDGAFLLHGCLRVELVCAGLRLRKIPVRLPLG